MRTRTLAAFAVAAAAGAVGLAAAQAQSGSGSAGDWSDSSASNRATESRQSQAQRSSGSAGDRYHDDWSGDSSGSNRGTDFQQSQAQRSGRSADDGYWVFISYDFNGDGSYDAYEYIWRTDLDEARRRTSMRPGAQARNQRQQQQWQHQQRWQQQQQAARFADRQYRISGQIRDLSTIRLGDGNQEHRIAKLDTDRGSVKVDLGPQRKLGNLSLSEGDQITVFGRHGRINDRRMLLATRIETDDQTVRVQRSRQSTQNQLRRIDGEVLSTRTATPRNSSREHLLAKVRGQQGQVLLVDLGPGLQSLDLKAGDDLRALGKMGSIDGRQALKAHHFHHDGQVHHVSGRSAAGARSTQMR